MNNPSMNTTVTDAIKTAFRSLLADELHTNLPAEITKIIDYKRKKVEVKPLIKRLYLDGTEIELPIISNVPVMYPKHGKACLKFPLVVGAKVLLIFSERSLDNFLLSGKNSIPANTNKFSLSDAIAIIGLDDFTKDEELISDNTSLELVYDKSKISIKENGDILIDNGDCTLEMTSSKVSINGSNFTVDK